MLESQANRQRLIAIAEDVALSACVHKERQDKMLALAMEVKFGVNWRTNTHSSEAAGRLYNYLVTKQVDMSLVLAMTSEFVFRSSINGYDLEADNPYRALAESITFVKQSTVLPEEVAALSSDERSCESTLRSDPWIAFLYLLSMSNAVSRLAHTDQRLVYSEKK